MKKKLTYWSNRWKTIPIEIRIIFIISFLMILSIEFIFSYFYAYNQICYKLGQFILKLSYASTSATIFYFIIQHLPRERKRIRLHSLLSYKIYYVEQQIFFLYRNLFGQDKLGEMQEMSFIRCSNLLSRLKPDSQIVIADMFTNGTYSLEEYFKLSITNILKYCDEILVYNEFINTNLLHRVSKIKSQCENILHLKIYNVSGNFRSFSDDVYKILQHQLELSQDLQNYSKNYHIESRDVNLIKHKIKNGEELEGDDIVNF